MKLYSVSAENQVHLVDIRLELPAIFGGFQVFDTKFI